MFNKTGLISKHAKTFSWASFFLPDKIFNNCSSLYDFCRTLDDIADEPTSLKIKKQKFLIFKDDFIKKNFSNIIIKNIWKLIQDDKKSEKILLDLFDGVESDLVDKVEILSENELITYSYQVAGTVGLMMSKILGVTEKDSLIGAINLGIGMQLTNISRDIKEDKKRNRFNIKNDFEEIKKILLIADQFYNSSFHAIKSIPFSSRFSILVARRIYRKIGHNILKKRNIENYLKAGRIYVSNFDKILQKCYSIYDFFKLQFFKNDMKKINIIPILEKKINLDERI